MSDGGGDPTSIAIGAGVAGTVGLIIAFVKALFNRNVSAADAQAAEMRTDVKNILLEIRSMHDEQTRQRAEIGGLTKDLAVVAANTKSAHERIDALVTPMPRRKK